MKKLVIKDNATIRRDLYNYLRKQILTNEIPPHERLVETKIAKETGASRTPVREALQDMEREGLIEKIPRVGYVVRPISEEELGQICRIRTVLEELAAAWAVDKSHEKLIRELKKNIAVSEKKILKGDIKTFVELDGQFHEIIAKLSRSTRLLELTQLLRRHMLRYRIQSTYHSDPARRAIAGHKAILNAIERSDETALNRAIHYHLEQSKKDILYYGFKENPEKTK